MKRFKLSAFKRKLDIFWPFEGFFDLHSIATERKKEEKWTKKGNSCLPQAGFSEWRKFKSLQ